MNQNNITFTSPQNFNGTESVNISVSDIKNSPNPNIGDKISVTFEEDDVVAYYEE